MGSCSYDSQSVGIGIILPEAAFPEALYFCIKGGVWCFSISRLQTDVLVSVHVVLQQEAFTAQR